MDEGKRGVEEGPGDEGCQVEGVGTVTRVPNSPLSPLRPFVYYARRVGIRHKGIGSCRVCETRSKGRVGRCDRKRDTKTDREKERVCVRVSKCV